MAVFRWRDYFNANGIRFVDHGKNVARDHINIRCPFCGFADPSHHMGIREEDGAWGCLRRSTHRGRNPVKLLMALSRITYDEAVQIAREGAPLADLSFDEMRQKASSLFEDRTVEFTPVELLDDFKRPEVDTPTDLYLRYLKRRGFEKRRNTRSMMQHYNILAAPTGDWRGRLIVPFYHGGALYGWTGRAIAPSTIKYKTWPPGPQPKRFLYNGDVAAGHTLVICEGVMDCLKLDWYGREFGMRSVAALGISLVDTQVSHLQQIAPLFDRVAIMLDETAYADAVAMADTISFLKPTILRPGRFFVDDPGEMHEQQVVSLAKSCRDFLRET